MTLTKSRKPRAVGQPTKGWSKRSPNTRQRTVMLKKCGRKCFLGPKKSFPICTKGTCKINPKGVYAAYVRARQWGKPKTAYKTSKPSYGQQTYKKIATTAKRILKNRFGYKNVGRKRSRVNK